MPRARRTCPVPGCPALTTGGRCPTHRRQTEQARGTRQQRGYDTTHQQLRASWQQRLDHGEHITCTSPTCLTPSLPIDPHEWDLGHDEHRQHRGPEHARCNRSAGGRSAHGA